MLCLVLLAAAASGCGGGDDEAAPEACDRLIGEVLTKERRDAYCTQDGVRAGWMGVGDAYTLVDVETGAYLGLRFCKGQPVERSESAEQDC